MAKPRMTPPSNVGASYSRYSTDYQHEASNADQQRTCRDKAKSEAVTIDSALEFADQAVSGTKSERSGLNAMLQAAKEGRFGVIYFENLSRLARQMQLSNTVLHTLTKDYKIRVVSVAEGLDSTRPGWNILSILSGLRSETYLEDLRSSVIRGQEGVVLAGDSVGDWGYGYTSVPVAGSEALRRGRHPRPRMRYAIDAEASRWVLQIFLWFAIEKHSIGWITRELNRQSVKGHGVSTTPWHSSQVRRILANKKYIGQWSWGVTTNRRSSDGRVTQEDRPESESSRFLRNRPDLRIVPQELWDAAQARLAIHQAEYDAHRSSDGRLRGGPSGPKSQPKHLLQGLLRCSGCAGVYQVGGSNGHYLQCRKAQMGICGQKTMIPRRQAETAILSAVRSRMEADPVWRAAVHAELEASHRALSSGLPSRRLAATKALAAVERQIAALLDSVENQQAGPDIHARLASRRAERETLQRKMSHVERDETSCPEAPTAGWLSSKLAELRIVLSLGGTQAALALRALLGGQVKVGVLERPGRARHTPTLTFTMGAAAASAHLSGLPAPAIAPDGGDAIQLVLTKPVESEELADEVKALWDEGWLLREIGERLGKPRGLVETALKTWHRVRGLPEPDARARVKRPAQVPGASPLVIRITDAAKALYDQGLAYQEIAKRLEVGRDAITAAIKYWHVLHEVPVPDGRTRRHQDARLDPGTDPITNTTQLVEAAKALSDEGLEYKEIARRLAVSGATITDAIKRWHVQRDLPVPDGRARRHQLKRSGLATGSDPSSPPFAA